ncbi:MAG: alcohol dehydrogenase [Cohnella sp.]|uniref:zinc-dependent alcohol dehydrogenase n=1 Tax=Cohnella sp. TaxID=1883426 RepID=UPI000E387DA3|nr:zinc-binding alcohol dehydrogenase [Cohnella sp.]REK68270.1 MAG: alcohol dehydrogenase [Cohnella sp.]
MKTVIAQAGAVKTAEQPKPRVAPNFVLIQTVFSAISPGTEMSMVKRAGDRPVQLGYSASGIVLETGEGVAHVRPGQKVACYGAPFVHHAETLAVPKHLVAPVPDGVTFEEASLAGLGAIAIHALRQADLHFGESVIVVGLGILGQIIAQVAHAASCHVIGHDLLPSRCELLRRAGISRVFDKAEEMERHLSEHTRGEGADAVILCAGGHAPELINASLRRLRDRGKIVVVGDLKMEFERELMFAKEAQILISRAGGPGRYDRDYEVGGFDYPVGYVRWTEGRNVEEYLRLLAEKKLRVRELISEVVDVENAADAYRLYTSAPERTVGVLLRYAGRPA